jgi:hypothetical protein
MLLYAVKRRSQSRSAYTFILRLSHELKCCSRSSRTFSTALRKSQMAVSTFDASVAAWDLLALD